MDEICKYEIALRELQRAVARVDNRFRSQERRIEAAFNPAISDDAAEPRRV